ncbi:MAG: 2'-5' RNA ligase family protein [Chloroflexota bacterium]|nr:2'-5' RNA ligase family protein [Chloroflexota bacterium]
MDHRHLEENPRVRFGFYLRPPYAMSRAQAEIHDLLRRQFGIEVGGKFMPHATIMGFFRSDASIEKIKGAIDGAVAGHQPFTVTNCGPKPHKRSGISLDVHHDEDGTPNSRLQAIHESAYNAIVPLVHPDCEFAFNGWAGEHFRAHLTLAMADIPDFLFDEVLEFIESAEPIGPRQFPAEYFSLYAFQSDDWGGAWWETVSWQPLHSWRLGA